MISKPKAPLKKIRCASCGKLAPSLIHGACPECTRIATAFQNSGWQFMSQIGREFKRHDGLVLACIIQGKGPFFFQALALETGANSLEAALESHGHHLIGQYTSIVQAIGMCEKFALEWLGGKRIEACGCSDLASKRKKP